jgi:hypothetical protein
MSDEVIHRRTRATRKSSPCRKRRLMAYIAECVERGRKGPTKSLAEIKAELLADEPTATE